MSGARREERQLAELRRLCAAGSVSRAIDLAFEHFAEFGLSEELVALVRDALERTDAPAAVRERFRSLCAGRRR